MILLMVNALFHGVNSLIRGTTASTVNRPYAVCSGIPPSGTVSTVLLRGNLRKSSPWRYLSPEEILLSCGYFFFQCMIMFSMLCVSLK